MHSMNRGNRLKRLDERLLGGRAGVALVLAAFALVFALGVLAAVLDTAWLQALALGALTVVTVQAASRTWRSRPRA